MKLDPGMHIGMHLVFFGKSSVTVRERSSERSRAGVVRALRRHPRGHLDLEPAVQRT
jgi:hypothetical protein